eukprot:scaffold19299_cov51-Attheya_sp.AAC.3
MLIPPRTDCRVVVLLGIVCQHVFHRKGRQCRPAQWEEANKKVRNLGRLLYKAPKGTTITIFVMMDRCCVSIKRGGAETPARTSMECYARLPDEFMLFEPSLWPQA